MKKRMAAVISAVAALAIVLTVIVTAFIYHGIYEESIRASLVEEVDILASAYTPNGAIQSLYKGSGRLTLIGEDGSVEYDSVASTSEMENHGDRKEVKEALATGRGSDQRQSDTLSIKQLYEAVRLPDGKVLRLSKEASTLLAFFSLSAGPVISLVIVLLILVVFISARASDYLVAPINALDLDNPEDNRTYDEISPLLLKIARQKREMAEELKDKERARNEFEFIVSSLSEGLVVLSRDGKVLSFNKSAGKLLSCSLELGEHFITLLPFSEGKDAVLSSLKGEDGEAVFTVKGRVIELSAYPSGSGAVVLMRDISEKSERDRMRREFTANVSHELKTPITTIMGFSELMKDSSLPSDKVVEFSAEINKEALRLKDTVSDIISLSSLDEGKLGEKKNINLSSSVKEEVDKLKNKAQQMEVTVKWEVDPALTVRGWERTLSEVLSNLLDNAIRYNRKGGEVFIKGEKADKDAKITVSDTGIGIPEEAISRIFERFYRVDKSRSRESGGTGLGLSIVKNGVERMEGSVKAESRLGKGTTFIVKLPLGRES